MYGNKLRYDKFIKIKKIFGLPQTSRYDPMAPPDPTYGVRPPMVPDTALLASRAQENGEDGEEYFWTKPNLMDSLVLKQRII